MEQSTKTSPTKWWAGFAISVVVSVLIYVFIPELTSLMCVPLLTTFAKALDLF